MQDLWVELGGRPILRGISAEIVLMEAGGF
jgi:hypothetical protein